MSEWRPGRRDALVWKINGQTEIQEKSREFLRDDWWLIVLYNRRIRSNGQNKSCQVQELHLPAAPLWGVGTAVPPEVWYNHVKLMGWHQGDLPADLRCHGLSMALMHNSFFNPCVEIFWIVLYISTSETTISLQNELITTEISTWISVTIRAHGYTLKIQPHPFSLVSESQSSSLSIFFINS